MRHAFVRIAVEEGPLSFFAGLSASILGLSHIMIQFPLYERIKHELASRHEREQSERDAREAAARPATGARQMPPRSRSLAPPPIWDIIAASAISKLVASTVTYPHEVIRARLQYDQGGKQYAGLLDATRKTIAADGLGGLWLGFRLNIVRTIPQCVVTFTLYECAPHTRPGRGRGAAPHQPTAAATRKHCLFDECLNIARARRSCALARQVPLARPAGCARFDILVF